MLKEIAYNCKNKSGKLYYFRSEKNPDKNGSDPDSKRIL